MFWRKFCLFCVVVATAGCSRQTKPIDVEKFLQDFIGAYLAMTPVTATQTGFHNYEGVNLDSILDDWSEHGVKGFRIFYNTMHLSADRLDSPKLSAEVRADFDLIRKFCEAQLFDLDTLQTYRHNPTMYVELIGNALFGPYTLSYAPEETRWKQIISRLKQVPKLLDSAKANLTDAPEIWNTVAQSENEGNIALIDKELREKVPESLRDQYKEAANSSLAALRSFNDWLRTNLSQHKSDWRLGPEHYRRKFNLVVANGQTPEQTLQAANTKLEEIRTQMAGEARNVWKKYFPGQAQPRDTNELIRSVLDRMAQDHPQASNFFDVAKRDVAEASDFVKAHHLVNLPNLDNLQIIPTPEFMRGVFGVAGFQPAPPLEPKLGAFFWITPFDPQMPPAERESKLREYNRWGMKILAIHEAMPGHYVQFQYSQHVDGQSRAVLRQILSNGPYVEGWAVYATQFMIDEGFDRSPEMKLNFGKQMLRVVANTILDIKMQTAAMSDDDALDLMVNQTFQERQEAVAKVRRAKLTSCQLPTYFAGWQGWLRLRSEYQAKKGNQFSLEEFHDRALKEGALPLSEVSRLLLASL